MALGSTPSIAILGIITIVGAFFAFDGYNLVNQLLAWIGWIAGAGAGGILGWFAATNIFNSPSPLLIAAGAFLIGALLGRILVPLVSWLAIVLLGFVSTSLAALFVLAGQQLATTISELNTTITSLRELELLIDQLATTPAFHNQQLLALTAIAGLIGAILASKYYDFIITTAITTVGAALLSVVLPLWDPALSGGVTLSESALTGLSTGLFALLLVIGLLIQGYRYGEKLNLPFLGDDYDPLAGE